MGRAWTSEYGPLSNQALQLINCKDDLNLPPQEVQNRRESSRNVVEPAISASKGRAMSGIGVSLETLSSSAKTDIEIIASVIQSLGLQTLQPRKILQKVLDIRTGVWELQAKQREADALSRKLQYKIDFMDLGTEKLKQLIGASDDQKAERLDRIAYSRQNIADESLKAELYEEELNQLNKQLALCGFASEFRHNILCQRSHVLAEKQKEIERLTEGLREYSDLPPDISAAQNMYAHVHSKLQDVNSQFEAILAGF